MHIEVHGFLKRIVREFQKWRIDVGARIID